MERKPDKQMVIEAIEIVKKANLSQEVKSTILNIIDKSPEIGWKFDTRYNAIGLVVGIAKGLLYAWNMNQDIKA